MARWTTSSVLYTYSDPSTGGLLTAMVYPNGRTIDYSYGSGMSNANAAINNFGSWTPITSSIEPITFGQSFNDLLSGEGFAARSLQIAPNIEQQFATASLMDNQPDDFSTKKSIIASGVGPQISYSDGNDLLRTWSGHPYTVSWTNIGESMSWNIQKGISIPLTNSHQNDSCRYNDFKSCVSTYLQQHSFEILLNPKVNL